MKKSHLNPTAPRVTAGDIFDDLGLAPAEALEAKLKADLWRSLVGHIDSLRATQRDLARTLQVHQPDVSNLLAGKLSRFSIHALIQFALRLGLNVQVKLISTRKPVATARPPRPRGLSKAKAA